MDKQLESDRLLAEKLAAEYEAEYAYGTVDNNEESDRLLAERLAAEDISDASKKIIDPVINTEDSDRLLAEKLAAEDYLNEYAEE